MTNEKILALLRDVYSEIKLTIGAKNFLNKENISKSVFTEILKGTILPSLDLLERIEQRLKLNLLDDVYKKVDYIRGKTNSTVVKIPKEVDKDLVYILSAVEK